MIGLLTFRLPDYWLARRIKQRGKNIVLQLPDALDLLTISVEAGLGFDGAMLEVIQKWDNELAQEFSTVLNEMKLGKSRRDALRGLSSRVKVQELQLFISAIVQADEIGMSISRTLAVQAEQMRQRRRQKAEEMAHKAVIKIIFPMVFFIFPALFIVLLGPAIPKVLGAFSVVPWEAVSTYANRGRSRFSETINAASQLEIETDFHIRGYRAEGLMTVTSTNNLTIRRRLYMGILPYVRNTYAGKALTSVIPTRSPSSVLTMSPSVSKRDSVAAISSRYG